MGNQSLSFEHPDLSKLAKFIRKELFTAETPPKHTDVLNVLARSRGFRNFQALKHAYQRTSWDQRLIALTVVDSSVREYYIRDSENQLIDRRHAASVEQLQFTMNVELELGHVRAEIVVHAIGSGRNWNFDASYNPDEDRVAESTLSALAEQLKTAPSSLFTIFEVAITLPKSGRSQDRLSGRASKTLTLHHDAFTSLERAVCEQNDATRVCEGVVEWVQDVARDPDSIRAEERAVLTEAADYFDAIVEASGQPMMYSWNREKMGGIRDALEGWARGRSSSEYERKYVFDNLFVFDAPTSWVSVAPMVPAALRSIVWEAPDLPNGS